ncbi:MAG: hypothetical protein WAW22_00600 [Smithellaceae bacterium]|jgi:hypothetical protein
MAVCLQYYALKIKFNDEVFTIRHPLPTQGGREEKSLWLMARSWWMVARRLKTFTKNN